MDTSAMIDGISKTELEHMERIDSDIMERTLSYYHQFDFSTFTSADVQNALQKEQLSALDFAAKKTRCYSPVLYHLAYLFSYFTLFITCRASMITTAIMTA